MIFRCILFVAIATSANAQRWNFSNFFDNLFPENRTGFSFPGRNPNRTGLLEGIGNARDNLRERRQNFTQGIITRVEERTGIDIPDWIGNDEVGLVGNGICGVAIRAATNIDSVAEFITNDDIDCNCGITDGYAFLGCEITSEICVEESVCGTVDLRGQYHVSGRRNEEFYKTTGCFTLQTDGLGDYKDFCVELDHSGTPDQLSNAEFFIFDCDMWSKDGGVNEKCSFCQACNDNKGIAFDCSNVDLDKSPDSEFTIPSNGECMQLLGANDLIVGNIIVPMPQFV